MQKHILCRIGIPNEGIAFASPLSVRDPAVGKAKGVVGVLFKEVNLFLQFQRVRPIIIPFTYGDVFYPCPICDQFTFLRTAEKIMFQKNYKEIGIYIFIMPCIDPPRIIRLPSLEDSTFSMSEITGDISFDALLLSIGRSIINKNSQKRETRLLGCKTVQRILDKTSLIVCPAVDTNWEKILRRNHKKRLS